MNILKNLVLLLVGIIALFVVGGLLLPGQIQFERSVVVKASPELIYGDLTSFKRFNEWSPWAALDPSTRYEYSGPAQGVGARLAWVSDNPNVGSGSQEIIAVTPLQQIQVRLDFGGTSTESVSQWTLTPTAEGTRLSWGMRSELGLNPINRWFGFLLLERFVGADYEKGLAALKPQLEAMAASAQATPAAEVVPETSAAPVIP